MNGQSRAAERVAGWLTEQAGGVVGAGWAHMSGRHSSRRKLRSTWPSVSMAGWKTCRHV